MASVDIMSILQSSYSAASQQSLIPVGAKFAPVDATKYTGTWTGKDSNGQAFSLVISKVSGYRANVTYQSAAGGLQYQRQFELHSDGDRQGSGEHHSDRPHHRHTIG
jgi:hypothetical protein